MELLIHFSFLSHHFLLNPHNLLLSLSDRFKNWVTGSLSYFSSKGQNQDSNFMCVYFFKLKYSWFRRRQWHSTPVLLPGKSHGQRSLVGCSPWGREEFGHNWATSLSLFTFMHWRRKWQPTPVFLPGESQGQGSLMDCRLWGRTESDTTEVT